MNTEHPLTLRQFAKLVDRSPSTIHSWCAAGMPHQCSRKANAGFEIDLTRALPWVLSYAHAPAKESQRERLARARAIKIETDNARAAGDFVRRVDIERLIEKRFASIMSALEKMPSRVAAEIAK